MYERCEFRVILADRVYLKIYITVFAKIFLNIFSI